MACEAGGGDGAAVPILMEVERSICECVQGLHKLHVRPKLTNDDYNNRMTPEAADMRALGVIFAHLCLMDGSWDEEDYRKVKLPESADKLRPPIFKHAKDASQRCMPKMHTKLSKDEYSSLRKHWCAASAEFVAQRDACIVMCCLFNDGTWREDDLLRFLQGRLVAPAPAFDLRPSAFGKARSMVECWRTAGVPASECDRSLE
jgi:hypothetical protein